MPKKKIRWFLVIIYIIGLFTISVFFHEATHWYQYKGYQKDMCVSTRTPIAFVNVYNNQEEKKIIQLKIWPFKKFNVAKNEIEASLVQFIPIIFGLIYVYKSDNMFFKLV